MPDPIVGLNRTALWNAWKVVRKQLHHSSRRDVVDFLEYDIDPDKWIRRLLRDLSNGVYEPAQPKRFSLAKSRGFSRRLTFPAIPDLVVYRAVVDHLFERLRRRQHAHVYFEQEVLTKAANSAALQATSRLDAELAPYGPTSAGRFLAWLHYDQYRKFLIFKKLYPYILITDITNFFDSILYTRVSSALHGLSAPPQMVGLLFFLLERLSLREAYTESPRIGLPVDEFDCSRKVAHLVLFPHDDRMTDLVGEDAYVRWMDDQNMGVKTKADGLRLLAAVDRSLSRLHLVANTSKSRLLTLKQARRHFHLDLNAMLDAAERLPSLTAKDRRLLARKIGRIWLQARRHQGVGEWAKILKRIYRLAGRARSRLLRRRAAADIQEQPPLTRRISDYMRASGTPDQYFRFVEGVWSNPEQIYADVNVVLTESFLRLEPNAKIAAKIRDLASRMLSRRLDIEGCDECAPTAPLLILRFGDRRSLPLLRRSFQENIDRLPLDVVRSAAVVFASYGVGEFRAVRRAAALLLRGHLAEMVRLVERIIAYDEVPGSYKARLNERFDAVENRVFIDIRSIVAARLLALNRQPKVRKWLADKIQTLRKKKGLSAYDRALLTRLVRI